MKSIKINLILACIAGLSLTFTGCKKDDDKSSSTTSTTATTSTTSTTATTSTTGSATDPNTIVFDGKVINGVVGNCEYSSMLTITGEVNAADGNHYFVSVDFSNDYPESGEYTTVEQPTDAIDGTQCHLSVNRTKGSYILGMLAPSGAKVKVVKTGLKYKISFDSIKFNVKKGGNGTRTISCTPFGC